MLPVGEALKVLLLDFPTEPPLLGQSAMPFTAYAVTLGVIVLLLNQRTLIGAFRRLRRLAGVARHDGAIYQPRMHDFRHTFAVRLSAWIKHGADLNRMIPALSAYIGQVGLGSTYRYLNLTPERFRAQLDKLSPRRGKRHWRDNPALMRFLTEL